MADRNGQQDYNRPRMGDRNPPKSDRNAGQDYNRPYRGDRDSQSNGNGGGNGNGKGRLTGKQYRYLLQLTEKQGRTAADLDQQCLELFGSVAQFLKKSDASSLIEQMLSR